MQWCLFRSIVPGFIIIICINLVFLSATAADESKPLILRSDTSLDDSTDSVVRIEDVPTRSVSNASTTEVSSVSEMVEQKPGTVSPSLFDLNSTNSSPPWLNTINSGALQRTGYVVLGFMTIILAFFVVRSIRLHHKKSKSRKYGIITASEMEMEPLDNNDEDEEMTLYDAQHKYSSK